MKVYTIIPARGGSKGIPHKNLTKVNGQSLIEIGVTQCKKAKLIDEVIISTDNTDIKNEAVKYGAKVVLRPAELSTDIASSESAVLHTLTNLKEIGLAFPDIIVFMQITSPFTIAKHIDGIVKRLLESKADSCFSGTLFFHFLWERKELYMYPINHETDYRPRRQDIDNCFIENGALYAFKAKEFLKQKSRFFGKIEIFEMDQNSSFEIDSPFDLKLANFLSNQ